MNDRIKSNDIIDDELFIKVSQNAESFYKNLTIIEAGLKAILEEAKKVMATTVFANSADLEKYTEAVLKAAKANEILAKSELIREKATGQSIKNEAARTKEAEKARKESEKATKQAEKEAKAQAALSSEYKQASLELRNLEQRIKDNAIAGRDASVTGKMLIEYHKELKAKVIAADESVGDFRRNVGNYKSGFDGLGMSINQLTREFPAFANSVQTGFMAISNNLPIFFDEIKKTQAQIKALRAEGQQVPGLFAQLTTSIFSWGTALSVGVTLLTVYGGELIKFISTLGEADEGFKLSYEKQSAYYTKLRELIEKQLDSQLKLNVAQGKMTQQAADDFKLNYDKQQAISKLKSEYQNELKEILEIYNKATTYINQNTGGSDKQRADNLKALENYKRAYNESTARYNKQLVAIEKATQNEIDLNAENARIEREKKAEDERKKRDAKAKELTEQDKRMIAEGERIEALRQKAKDIMDEYNSKPDFEEKDGIVWYDKENGITLEDHNQTLEDIAKHKGEVEREEAEAERKRQEKRRKEAEEAREDFNTALNFIDALNRARSEKIDRQLSIEMDKRQRNIQQQQQLAAQGLDNTLAFEKEALAKAELQRQQEAKKREREAKTLAFLKLISSFADKGDNQAVMKAFLQMAIATAITGSFAEGVEGLEGPGTETSDSILARLSKNESVITAKGTKQNPGLATAMNKGKVDEYFENEYLPKYMVSHDVGSFAENAYSSLMLQQITALNKKIESFEKVVKERPVHQTELTKLGEVVETKITNGFKKITTHKNTNNLI